MLRAEKILKRQARAQERRLKKNEKYFAKIRAVREINVWLPLSAVTRYGLSGSWEDPSSPTGYSQVCSYEAYGTCQSPCNGDC